ncbi:MAG: M56 family metallopeptidase [Lewinellaceae bacterium]|nr:M56 family metallopeptidase [Lewinellaceae bacterium]
MMIPTVFQAIGWAVFHSIWQIALLYLAFKVSALIFPTQGNFRYRLAMLTMLLACCWSAFTFLNTFQRLQPAAKPSTIVLSESARQSVALSPENQLPVAHFNASTETLYQKLGRFLPWLGLLWFLGAAVFATQLLGGILANTTTKKTNQSGKGCHTDPNQCLATKLGIRKWVQVLESKQVQGPMTIGFWKPVILLPIGLHLHITPAQLEALLIHELAHIRRLDYLVNLIQLVMDTLFFYHPLFRLLSKEARVQREYACDDIVLLHTSDQLLYARTLVDLNLHFSSTKNVFTMAASGNSPFNTRIMRLTGITPQRADFQSWLILPLLGFSALIFAPKPAEQATPNPANHIFSILQPEFFLPAPAAVIVANKPEPKATVETPAVLTLVSDSVPNAPTHSHPARQDEHLLHRR